jgi:protein SCO1/2
MFSKHLGSFSIFVLLLPLALITGEVGGHGRGDHQNVEPAAGLLNSKSPDFMLIDQNGRPFHSNRLRGKVVAVNFIFTTCPDICPIFTAAFAQLQRKLDGRTRSGLFFLSITTDPESDSPRVLKTYAQRHGANLQNWAFLTGNEAQLKQVWKDFGVRVIRRDRGSIQHTNITAVLDRDGIRRFNYLGQKWQLDDLQNDIVSLLEKKSTKRQ